MGGSGHGLILGNIWMEGVRKTMKTSVRTTGLWAKILTQDLMNTKQGC
jgi:hypothetical protein